MQYPGHEANDKVRSLDKPPTPSRVARQTIYYVYLSPLVRVNPRRSPPAQSPDYLDVRDRLRLTSDDELHERRERLKPLEERAGFLGGAKRDDPREDGEVGDDDGG